MKKLLCAAVISLVSVYGLRAQIKSTEKEAVQKVIVDVFQALADRDTGQLKSNCTAGFLLLENGLIWNVDSLSQRIDQNKAITDFKRINTFDFIATKVRNNTAWTTYSNQAEVTKNGQHSLIKWLETAVLIKEGKAWKIEVLHSTLIKRSEK
jgi:hypothetical protein